MVILLKCVHVQRCAKMAALLDQHRAHTVVDVGCGDGKLIEYLMQQVCPYLSQSPSSRPTARVSCP